MLTRRRTFAVRRRLETRHVAHPIPAPRAAPPPLRHPREAACMPNPGRRPGCMISVPSHPLATPCSNPTRNPSSPPIAKYLPSSTRSWSPMASMNRRRWASRSDTTMNTWLNSALTIPSSMVLSAYAKGRCRTGCAISPWQPCLPALSVLPGRISPECDALHFHPNACSITIRG